MTTSPKAAEKDPALHRLLYVSRAAFPAFSETDLDIMRAGMRNNPAVGVAGFLRRQGDHYLQVLEGAELTIARIVDRIHRDPRHSHMKVLLFQPVDEARFHCWSMGYCSEYPPPFDPDQLNDPDAHKLSEEIINWLAQVAAAHRVSDDRADDAPKPVLRQTQAA